MTTTEIALLAAYLFMGLTLSLRQAKRHKDSVGVLSHLLAMIVCTILWLPLVIVEHLDD